MLQALTGIMTLGCGAGTLLGMGYYPGIAVLFERESIVEAEGFRNDFYPVPELLARIRRLPSNRRRHELFIPAITMEEIEACSTPCHCALSRVPGGRIRIVSGSICLLVLFVIIVTLTKALITAQTGIVQTLTAALLTAYLTTVTIAALSVSIAKQLFHRAQTSPRDSFSKGRLLSTLLCYPFLLLKCFIWPKNFIKS